MITTAQQVIDRARLRHWTFSDVAIGDGAVLVYLSQRLRTHLAIHGAKIEGLVNTTLTYAIESIGGLLVAEDEGVPVYTTTYQDGWALHVDEDGVPYFDATEPMIAVDPYGENGGTPGFPLPSEMVRLIDVSAVYSQPQNVIIPIDVIKEHGRLQAMPGRNPQAFVSGNRLVPLLPFAGASLNTQDRWVNVASLIMSYVALPTLATFDDVLNLPAVLAEALDADAALMLARQSQKMPPADRAGFERAALEAASAVSDAALDMLGEPQNETVTYNG